MQQPRLICDNLKSALLVLPCPRTAEELAAAGEGAPAEEEALRARAGAGA